MPLKRVGNEGKISEFTFPIGDLPLELFIDISEHIENEVRSTGSMSAVRDFLNFSSAATFTKAATSATPQLRELKERIMKFKELLGRAKPLAQDTYDAAAPEGWIPADQSSDSVKETIGILGSLLYGQSDEWKRNFAKSLMEIRDDSVRNEAIAQSVKYLPALDAEDRAPLIHESIRVFTGTVTTHRDHSTAREALAEAYSLMEPEHHAALEKGLLKRFDRKDLGQSLSLEIRRQAERGAKANGENDHTKIPTASEINQLRETLRRALKVTEPHSFERMDALEPVADLVASSLNSARQALKTTERERGGSGRAS